MEKYYLSNRVAATRKEITSARQDGAEMFFEYWSRFQDLLAKCPNHQIPPEHLVQYFYNGLMPQDADMLTAATNGSLEDMEPASAWELIQRFALNRQHISVRDTRAVREVDYASRDLLLVKVATDLASLTKTVESLRIQQPATHQLAMVAASCTSCNSSMHSTQDCPTRYEDVSAMFQRPG